MRGVTTALIGMLALTGSALAATLGETDLQQLRKDWHDCVRGAFDAQAPTAQRQAAERAALARCKPAEDSYVAAELAAQQAADEARQKGGLTSRAKAWVYSVASYVVDPVASWIGGLSR